MLVFYISTRRDVDFACIVGRQLAFVAANGCLLTKPVFLQRQAFERLARVDNSATNLAASRYKTLDQRWIRMLSCPGNCCWKILGVTHQRNPNRIVRVGGLYDGWTFKRRRLAMTNDLAFGNWNALRCIPRQMLSVWNCKRNKLPVPFVRFLRFHFARRITTFGCRFVAQVGGTQNDGQAGRHHE